MDAARVGGKHGIGFDRGGAFHVERCLRVGFAAGRGDWGCPRTLCPRLACLAGSCPLPTKRLAALGIRGEAGLGRRSGGSGDPVCLRDKRLVPVEIPALELGMGKALARGSRLLMAGCLHKLQKLTVSLGDGLLTFILPQKLAKLLTVYFAHVGGMASGERMMTIVPASFHTAKSLVGSSKSLGVSVCTATGVLSEILEEAVVQRHPAVCEGLG